MRNRAGGIGPDRQLMPGGRIPVTRRMRVKKQPKARVLGFERIFAGFHGKHLRLPPVKAVKVAYSEKPSDYSWPIHRHPAAIEVYYVDHGCIRISCRKRLFIIEDGQAAVIPPGCSHAIEGDPRKPANLLMIMVKSPGLLQVAPELAAAAGSPLDADENVKFYLAELFRQVRAGGPHAERLVVIGALAVLLNLAETTRHKAGQAMAERRGAASGGFAARVNKYVRLHLDKKLHLFHLARLLGCCVSSLCHRYHRLTGETPHQFTLRCRMERAREVLRRPDSSVNLAARESGFTSVPSFIKAFRRLERITPGTYRRSIRARF